MTFPRVPRRAVVLGAGVMGSGIAAHLANAGILVRLLDLGDLATQARARLPKIEPAPLFLPDLDQLITAGSLEQDLSAVGDADWVIEAIVEDLDAKQALLELLLPHWRPGIPVTTNTSGLPVARISGRLPPEFRRWFFGAHFFNPPRYMRLLELIPTADTDPGALAAVAEWGDRLLGKGIVVAKDTPNFIANRIGTYGFLRAVALIREQGLGVDEVDDLTGPLIGRPRSATFRTADLAGLDVALAVAENSYRHLPDDESRDTFLAPEPLREMVRRGWLGEKAGSGFYRRVNGQIEALDLETMTYRPRRKVAFPAIDAMRGLATPAERLRAAIDAQDRGGRFLWTLLRDVLIYAARRIPEISDDVASVDRAMRLGFGWSEGPFEIWDLLGPAQVATRAEADGIALPPLVRRVLDEEGTFYTQAGVPTLTYDGAAASGRVENRDGLLVLADLKKRSGVITRNADASLLDLGDGVACVEFHAGLNILGEGIIGMISAGLDRLEREFDALVVGTAERDFSAGANLMLLLMEAQDQNWEDLDFAIRSFQQMNQRIRHSAKPVVSAAVGRTLAGGAEICLACAGLQAAAETYMGLVETGVGLIPAGGGTMTMASRAAARYPAEVAADMVPVIRWTFETIALAKVSRSAPEAVRLGYLREHDRITMNVDRLIADTKETARSLVPSGNRPGHRAAPAGRVRVVGQRGRAALESLLYILKTGGHISAYDEMIGRKLAHVITGGDVPEGSWVDEAYLLDLEREAFLSLLGQPQTQDRMRHLLQTGKPLRN